MAIFVYGDKTVRTFENKMLRTFHRQLLTRWSGDDRNITLIANSLWGGAEIDLVCLVPNGVLLVDFKDYLGHITGAENGPWMRDGEIEVKGGAKQNPLHQLRDNKYAVMTWLKRHELLAGRNLGNIGAAVIFSGPITQNLDLPRTISRWFHVTDLNRCSELLADFAAPGLSVYERDVSAIVQATGVERMFDFSAVHAAPPPRAPRDTAPSFGKGDVSDASMNNTDDTPSGSAASTAEPSNRKPSDEAKVGALGKPVTRTFVYLGIAAIILAASIAFTPLLMRTSDGSPAHEVPVGDAGNPPHLPFKPTNNPQPERPRDPAEASDSVPKIQANEAPFHVKRTVLACGEVAQVTSFKKGTYLNLDAPFPRQTLTVVVWRSDESVLISRLGTLNGLKDRRVCALGQITQYRKHLQIEINNAQHLRLMK